MSFAWWLCLLSCIIASSLDSVMDKKFNQNKYILRVERAEVKWFDKTIFNNFSIWTFKYNRTTTALNIKLDFKVDIIKFQIIFLGYKLSNNEYKRTVLQGSVNACTVLSKNLFAADEMKLKGNFTNCPIRKGLYVMNNWRPNASKFPPGIPNGQWKLELKYVINNVEAAVANYYLNLVYTNKFNNN